MREFKRKLQILVIDDHIPFPALGVGYPRAKEMLDALAAMGHAITLAPMALTQGSYGQLERAVPAGVDVLFDAEPATLGSLLAKRTGTVDLILASRPNNLRTLMAALPQSWADVPVLYDAEALWAARLALQRDVEGHPLSTAGVDGLLQAEVDMAGSASHVMAVNDLEASVFRSRGCQSVSVVSHGFAPEPTTTGWAERDGLLFVGALDDDPSPNVDALVWFVREVLPSLRSQSGTPLILQVAGRCAAPAVCALAGPQVRLLGLVENLTGLYSSARVFIAPHRYAAGIPTKVLEAAARGLPCVCSDLLAQQLEWNNGREVLTARTANEFVRAITRLNTDPVVWNAIRSGGLQGIAQSYSKPRFCADLAIAVDRACGAHLRTSHVVPAKRRITLAGRTPSSVRRPVLHDLRRVYRQWVHALPGPLRRRVQAWQLAQCQLFDRDWYLMRYPDVAAAGADPATHYLLYGASEGRDPGPGFSTMGYLSRYPEVAARGGNPLLRYIDSGVDLAHEVGPRSQTLPHSQHVVFICGESNAPGLALRIENLSDAMCSIGATTRVLSIAEAVERPAEVAEAALLILWRTAWDDALAVVIRGARRAGAAVLFDADDLVIEPELAAASLIDGIRTQRLAETEVQSYFKRSLAAFEASDWTSCSTEELASHMRVRGKPTFVVPNGFNHDVHWRSRLALRRKLSSKGDGRLRIGYAAGTRTHQRDFAEAAEAIADVLRLRSQCCLVLFRQPNGEPIIDLSEFVGFADLGAQIEWRDFVAMEALPDELVRFDVNVAPVQTGNAFCESKSEIKFIDAALVGVCTVASPTGPFRRAIQHGHSGLLASNVGEWRAALLQLLDEPLTRQRIGEEAYRQVLWPHGPRRRADLAATILDQILSPARTAARAGAAQIRSVSLRRTAGMALPASRIVFAADQLGQSEVTVVVPLYNYAQFVVEALDSVAEQTLPTLDLIVVDDASTDDSLAKAEAWLRRHAALFNRIVLLCNRVNSGLGPTRNVAIDKAETPFVLPLDADNRLYPRACEALVKPLSSGQADFVFPLIQQFGGATDIMGRAPYSVQQLVAGNCIDAMALVRKECWAAVGGYSHIPLGWEDFDFWCKFAEFGFFGQQLPEVLAGYRVHALSMTLTSTAVAHNKSALVSLMKERHPWLSLPQDFGTEAPM